MAKYTTTTEELTSIADAIRTKTGDNSSLIYPTGFVSAIENISLPPYNCMGENPVLVGGPHNMQIKLKDTTFNPSSITTSNTNIYSTVNLGSQLQLSGEYSYVIKYLASIEYEYNSNFETNNRMEEGYFCAYQQFGKKPSTVSDFINNRYTYVSYGPATGFYNNIFYANNGAIQLTANAHGISFSLNAPAFTNQSADFFGCTLRSPTLRMNYYGSYMSQAAINALDTDKTIIEITIELYQVNANDIWHTGNEETIKLYQQKHNLI